MIRDDQRERGSAIRERMAVKGSQRLGDRYGTLVPVGVSKVNSSVDVDKDDEREGDGEGEECITEGVGEVRPEGCRDKGARRRIAR